MTKDEALKSLGRYGKIHNGAWFDTGQVVEVHSSGLVVKFARAGNRKPKWYRSEEVTLHELTDSLRKAMALAAKGTH